MCLKLIGIGSMAYKIESRSVKTKGLLVSKFRYADCINAKLCLLPLWLSLQPALVLKDGHPKPALQVKIYWEYFIA